MFKKIKELFNDRYTLYSIMFILIVIVLIFGTNANERNIEIDCTEKCEELGYDYFYSEPKGFFKNQDCKCRTTDNEIIDVI